MLQNSQSENYMPQEMVNQGTLKRYTDLPSNIPASFNFRKPQQIPINYNTYNNQNIPNNSNTMKSQEMQTQKKEILVPEDKPIIPEKTISDFYKNEFLSDAILKVEENEIKFHKVILSAASEFLYKYFTINPSQENNAIPTIALPEIMKSSFSQGNKKDCIEKVMKYCYNNQDIKSIEDDITQYNCFTMLELAHCLGIKSLNKNLEKLIIKKFLKDDNMIKISEESNNFELPELHKECSNRIKKNIGNVSNKTKELTELNYETFKDIISSDEIDLEGEKEIADLVLEYIKSRREIPEEKESEKIVEKIEIKVNQEIINQENGEKKEEEKKEEEEKKDEEEKKEEEKKEEEEEKKIDEQNNEENKPPENTQPQPQLQNDENDPYNQWKKHLQEIETKSKKKRLTPEEEKTLVYCIRFSFLSHADLISLSNDPIMKDYKDLLLQGLSARLNTYENTDDQKNLINLTPRNYLRGQQATNIKPNLSNNNNMYNNINNMDMNQNQNFEQNQMMKSVGNFGEQNQYMKQYNNPQRNYSQTYQNISPNNNDINSNMNNNFSDSRSYYEENNNNSNQMKQDMMNIDDMNAKKKKLGLMIKSSTSPYPPQDPRISEDFFRNQLIMSVPKPIFKYTYDFDENGALYFLGTKGKRHQYRNPHEINMVKAFASSISKGQVSDFVGRNLVNLRTENEENSFFGVDLGKNRCLVPTAYSIRNRNSSSHVMLCWNLEASNDKINFEILDTRIFSNVNNPQIHQKLEKERNLLREPGCTSTWGISRKIKERFPEGFRYFLIKQIDKNSNGSYNLAISGFELYGEGKGKGWIFN